MENPEVFQDTQAFRLFARCALEDSSLTQGFDMSEDELLKNPELIYAVLVSKAVETKIDKQSWLQLLPMMDDAQKEKLRAILVKEQIQLAKSENKNTSSQSNAEADLSDLKSSFMILGKCQSKSTINIWMYNKEKKKFESDSTTCELNSFQFATQEDIESILNDKAPTLKANNLKSAIKDVLKNWIKNKDDWKYLFELNESYGTSLYLTAASYYEIEPSYSRPIKALLDIPIENWKLSEARRKEIKMTKAWYKYNILFNSREDLSEAGKYLVDYYTQVKVTNSFSIIVSVLFNSIVIDQDDNAKEYTDQLNKIADSLFKERNFRDIDNGYYYIIADFVRWLNKNPTTIKDVNSAYEMILSNLIEDFDKKNQKYKNNWYKELTTFYRSNLQHFNLDSLERTSWQMAQKAGKKSEADKEPCFCELATCYLLKLAKNDDASLLSNNVKEIIKKLEGAMNDTESGCYRYIEKQIVDVIKTHIASKPTQLIANAKYYALLVGVGNYKNRRTWPDIDTPVPQMKQLYEVLKGTYGFKEIDTLFNEQATQTNITKAIEKIINNDQLDDNANVLIYFTGHGHRDDVQGYVIPYDSEGKDEILGKNISYNALKSKFNKIATKAPHLLFITDACFSGTFKVGTEVKEEDYSRIEKHYALHSATAFTASSAKEEVHHSSPFTASVIQVLKSNQRTYLTDLDLYNQASQEKMAETPQYIQIEQIDKGGRFIFRKNNH